MHLTLQLIKHITRDYYLKKSKLIGYSMGNHDSNIVTLRILIFRYGDDNFSLQVIESKKYGYEFSLFLLV